MVGRHAGAPPDQPAGQGSGPHAAAVAPSVSPFHLPIRAFGAGQEIVDSWDYELSTYEFLGDSFPYMFTNYGPGTVAAFLGAELHTTDETVWFRAPEGKQVSELSFAYSEQSPWYRQIRDLYAAAIERWQGLVQVSMADLGGCLDILSTFRPSEALLFDLYDHPEQVKRCTWEIHAAWHRYFQGMNTVLRPVNPGYTAWTPIFSEVPYYMLQCDFCYMIGPDMFDEFVKPELATSCRAIDHAFYHLDGPGQLAHLDSLLEIEALDGVQWIPGDGAKPITEWPDVYRKISEAGKKIQIFGTMDELNIIADQIGRADNIVLIGSYERSRRDDLSRELEAYGIGACGSHV